MAGRFVSPQVLERIQEQMRQDGKSRLRRGHCFQCVNAYSTMFVANA